MTAVNRDKPDRWKQDIEQSVDLYNNWFMHFAPDAYRTTRAQTVDSVEASLRATRYLTDVGPNLLRTKPSVLPTLRMSTCPPLAVDRLAGLAGVSRNLIKSMENDNRMPPRMSANDLNGDLEKIGQIIKEMADPDIFFWLRSGISPSECELNRAATIIADRLCGAIANPIIRNAQEKRQLDAIDKWLTTLGYQKLRSGEGIKYDEMRPGTYSFRLNVPIKQEGADTTINITADVAVMPKTAGTDHRLLLIEAKSAGDFANVNKRRKEEVAKIYQLRRTHNDDMRFILFLRGYFDGNYLGYIAAEGIDWIWEHRMHDLVEFGL